MRIVPFDCSSVLSSPVSTPAPPPPIPLSDGYIRLLAGSAAATSLDDEQPLVIIADHLQRWVDQGGPFADEYAAVLPQLRQCSKFERELTSAGEKSRDVTGWFGLTRDYAHYQLRGLVRQVYGHIQDNDVTLVPASFIGATVGHAMYLRFTKERDATGAFLGTYRLELFDTAGFAGGDDAWAKAHGLSAVNGKRQTFVEVTGAPLGEGADAINRNTLYKLLDLNLLEWGPVAGISDVYKWVMQKGRVTVDPQRRGQALQKVGNCTNKSVMAVLHASLSQEAFNETKARLLESAASQMRAPERWAQEPFLAQLVCAKAERARAKVNGTTQPRAIVRPVVPPSPRGAKWSPIAPPVPEEVPTERVIDSGQAAMEPGANKLEGDVFSARSAVYFKANDGEHTILVVSNEKDLARNIWLGRESKRADRLYIEMKDTRKGLRGAINVFTWHQGGSSGRSQVMVPESKVLASYSGEGAHPKLTGQLSGYTVPAVRIDEPFKNVHFAGTFEAAWLDMSHRQIARSQVESYARSR